MNTSIMPINVQAIRQDFPNLKATVRGKPLVYLDNAATTLKPQSVIDAVTGYYASYTSNVHRGVHYMSEKATGAYEDSREKIRAFINAQSMKEIIFTRGTTDSINLIAQTFGRKFLKEGDEVIISEMEHHSNIVPWQILREQTGCVLKIIPINDAGELLLDDFQKMFTPKTSLVSVVYVSNSLGTVNPVREIIRTAHSNGIPVLLDAAQAVNHMPVDVQELDCDFLAFSGHKLFGPTGIGVLYGKEEILDSLPPYQGGGDMISRVSFEETTYNFLPYKFEAGTPHIAGVIGLGAAIDYVQKIGLNAIQAYERELLDYGTRALSQVEGLKIIGTAKNKGPVLSFAMDEIHSHDMGTLIDEEGVAVRTGHHCTQPVMRHFNIPSTSRASLSFYNTIEEIEALVKAIEKAKKVFEQ